MLTTIIKPAGVEHARDRTLHSGVAIDGDPETFRRSFNKESFAFAHGLSDSKLLSVERLVEMARSLRDARGGGKLATFKASSFRIGTSFGQAAGDGQVDDTIRHLAGGSVWLKLSEINKADPAYAALRGQILDDISGLVGRDLKADITWSTMTVFVASPGVTTPYHIDHESNFLFQIHGAKQVCLFDPTDREVLGEEEIERFYAGDAEAARYKPALQSRGRIFDLAPGIAVHHPPLAPHWVENGDAISVSVSIGFCLPEIDRVAKVYQANSLLRRAGLRPTPPGRSRLADRLKATSLALASKPGSGERDDILFSGYRRVTAPFRMRVTGKAVKPL